MGGNGGNTSKGGSKDVQTYIIQEYKAYFFQNDDTLPTSKKLYKIHKLLLC